MFLRVSKFLLKYKMILRNENDKLKLIRFNLIFVINKKKKKN